MENVISESMMFNAGQFEQLADKLGVKAIVVFSDENTGEIATFSNVQDDKFAEVFIDATLSVIKGSEDIQQLMAQRAKVFVSNVARTVGSILETVGELAKAAIESYSIQVRETKQSNHWEFFDTHFEMAKEEEDKQLEEFEQRTPESIAAELDEHSELIISTEDVLEYLEDKGCVKATKDGIDVFWVKRLNPEKLD